MPNAELREAWRRWRGDQRLVDPDVGDFAQGGLARLTSDPAARLVILPADPEAHLIDFDSALWSWWAEDSSDPATDGRTQWGPHKLPTLTAAVIGTQMGDGQWWRYFALHRNGAVEAGLGDDAAMEHDGQRYFRLTTIVGRSWATLARYAEVIERFSVDGPWELTLSLRQTAGALLANFGEGWAEPGSGFGRNRPCLEANLLMRRELPTWPAEAEGLKSVAFSFGAQIEDAWGVDDRRFLAHRGERAGEFDCGSYGWR